MKFNILRVPVQNKIKSRFTVSNNTSNIYVDEFNRPYEKILNSKVYCTMRVKAIVGEGFHNYSRKNN